MEEGDGEGLDVMVLQQRARRTEEGLLIEGEVLGAVGQYPLGDVQAPVPGHEDGRRTGEEVLGVEPDLAPHLEHIAESLGGDESDLGAGPLQDGVGDQSGAVDDRRDVVPSDRRLPQEALDARQDPAPGVVGGGEQFAGAGDLA
ncbi:hypothetical protein LUX33_07035 [Actinomadura madurae]|nr:hypothetical protein [Actinomadura madurae]MCP9948193.1 hypothetical protein [Actinomadura madurae]